MIFSNRIKQLEKIVYDGFKIFLDSIARFLGYPDVPGMPIFPLDFKARDQLMGQDLLPKHITEIPPTQAQLRNIFINIRQKVITIFMLKIIETCTFYPTGYQDIFKFILI
jgi:hypothetical protein